MAGMLKTGVELLEVIEHRPWALPSEPWVMEQCWYDLLFAHWPLPTESLRDLVPRELPLDIFDGRCWVSVTPFHMTNCARVRALRFTSRFRELNCRTYVNIGGKPGVFFFSLDASSRLAVWGARTFYHLPYHLAQMRAEVREDAIDYSSQRGSARFQARYVPVEPVGLAARGTVEHWLTERYCLYTVHKGQIFRGDIHHVPWPLQPAKAEIGDNTIAEVAGIRLPDTKPLLAFSRELKVLIWPLKLVG
jgi:uncharacterized protein YqjF (DUF2071 family)